MRGGKTRANSREMWFLANQSLASPILTPLFLVRVTQPHQGAKDMRSETFTTFGKIRPAPCVFAAITMLAPAPAFPAPYWPSDDATALATIAPSGAPMQAEFRARQKALAANPADLDGALKVARLAICDGRASADPRRYGQAQAALSPWWSMDDAPVEVRVLRAVIRQALHDFKAAETDSRRHTGHGPKEPSGAPDAGLRPQDNWRIRRSQGRLPAMPALGWRHRCSRLYFAGIEALTGSAAPALQRLTQAMALDGKATLEVRRWAQAVAAEIDVRPDRRGDPTLQRSDRPGRRYSDACRLC